MPSLPEQSDSSRDDELPDALIAALRGAATQNVPMVTATVDAAILREAKAGFARRRRFRLAAHIAIGVAAAAAVVGIALPMMFPTVHRTPVQRAGGPPMMSIVPAAEDVDHNGKVDILDAFVVAKLVETGKQIDAAYDVNGDGKVDQSDVDRIAHAAVAVAPADDARRVQ